MDWFKVNKSGKCIKILKFDSQVAWKSRQNKGILKILKFLSRVARRQLSGFTLAYLLAIYTALPNATPIIGNLLIFGTLE